MSKNLIFVVFVNTEQLPIVFLGTILSLPLLSTLMKIFLLMCHAFQHLKMIYMTMNKSGMQNNKKAVFVSKFSKSFRKRIFNIYSLIFYFNSVFISI